MRHKKSGRHLARTSAHHLAMRRNLAQSLFQYGQIETTLIKAKEVRPFVERLITLARRNTLASRQRVTAMLNDRAALARDQQEAYESMSDSDRQRVLRARTGRRHRTGRVPAGYDKKKFTFVATSVVHRLMTEIAPKYVDRQGGYTRIIRLAKRRIGDGSDLALLQLVGFDETKPADLKKIIGGRRRRTAQRRRALEGKAGKSKKAEAAASSRGTAGGTDKPAE
jgi:large subunit ribosomal protein L17